MVPKVPTEFSVSLQRGVDEDIADIYFHLSARFGDTPMVVRNTRSGGSWGMEEHQGPVPFTPLQPFLLVLISYLDTIETEVNGSPQFTFKIRQGLPLSNITHLAIKGSVTIWSIHVPVESLPRNLRLSIPGHMKVGDMAFIRGTPPQGAEKFVVNVQCGPGKMDDITFHINPQFPKGAVVRNSRLDEQWGQEETNGSMPFTEDQPFDLIIAASSLGYHTWVDGKEFADFTHRQDINTATTLFIEGDLNCERIVIDSAQCHLPPPCDNNVNRNTNNSRLQVFCPELPLVSRITGGMDKGCVFVLTGEVPKSATRFEVNLQCDSADDADIALHYNPRWDDTDPVLILNSREDEKWGSVVRVKEDLLALHPGSHFDLLILFQDDMFRIFTNSTHQADFPLRLENAKPDHVTISGDVTVHRVLVV